MYQFLIQVKHLRGKWVDNHFEYYTSLEDGPTAVTIITNYLEKKYEQWRDGYIDRKNGFLIRFSVHKIDLDLIRPDLVLRRMKLDLNESTNI